MPRNFWNGTLGRHLRRTVIIFPLRPRLKARLNCCAAYFAFPNPPSAVLTKGPPNAIRLLAALILVLAVARAEAYKYANGVYRAGCVGPNGAVGVRKAYPGRYYNRGYYPPHRYPPAAACASEPYRAGCAGPNGAVVVRMPY